MGSGPSIAETREQFVERLRSMDDVRARDHAHLARQINLRIEAAKQHDDNQLWLPGVDPESEDK